MIMHYDRDDTQHHRCVSCGDYIAEGDYYSECELCDAPVCEHCRVQHGRGYACPRCADRYEKEQEQIEAAEYARLFPEKEGGE